MISQTILDSEERLARIRLACLPSMYPNRLRSILCHHSGTEALELLRRSCRLHPEIESTARAIAFDRLRAEATAIDQTQPPLGEADNDDPPKGSVVGCDAVVLGDSEYPSVLAEDPEAPEVLFYSGDLNLLSMRRVGVVGTRNATAAGRATAVQLGSELAAAGVAIVSGLARGIDAAAHRGVREAGATAAVAVVGSGVDQVYPKVNRALWEWVASDGLLVSEWPPGSSPEAWHFPLRNRVIAALSELVIVVESRESGGSLITVDAALQRGVDVMAVPGSRYCRASAGTNQLIAEGAGLVRDIDDVLMALELSHCSRATSSAPHRRRDESAHQLRLPGFREPGQLSASAAAVLTVCEERPVTIDQVVAETGIGVIEVARSITELEHADLIRDLNGWIESTGSRLGRSSPSTLDVDE